MSDQSKPLKSTSEASLYIFEFIEVFYNRTGMHSGLNYFSQAEFEQLSVNEEVRNCAWKLLRFAGADHVVRIKPDYEMFVDFLDNALKKAETRLD